MWYLVIGVSLVAAGVGFVLGVWWVAAHRPDLLAAGAPASADFAVLPELADVPVVILDHDLVAWRLRAPSGPSTCGVCKSQPTEVVLLPAFPWPDGVPTRMCGLCFGVSGFTVLQAV